MLFRRYLEKSRHLVHPLNGDLAGSDWRKQAIFAVLTNHPSVIASTRTEFLQNTLEKHAQLEAEEVLLHKSMAPHIRKVMKGRNCSSSNIF